MNGLQHGVEQGVVQGVEQGLKGVEHGLEGVGRVGTVPGVGGVSGVLAWIGRIPGAGGGQGCGCGCTFRFRHFYKREGGGLAGRFPVEGSGGANSGAESRWQGKEEEGQCATYHHVGFNHD